MIVAEQRIDSGDSVYSLRIKINTLILFEDYSIRYNN